MHHGFAEVSIYSLAMEGDESFLLGQVLMRCNPARRICLILNMNVVEGRVQRFMCLNEYAESVPISTSCAKLHRM